MSTENRVWGLGGGYYIEKGRFGFCLKREELLEGFGLRA